jgi:glycosyltransferase involved in cell wall biosynthesis
MVLGTPVLTSRVGGLKEILTHQQTALQFEPANERQIAETVARVAGDPSLRKALADAARADATTRFSAEAMTNQYVDLFESLVAVHRPE